MVFEFYRTITQYTHNTVYTYYINIILNYLMNYSILIYAYDHNLYVIFMNKMCIKNDFKLKFSEISTVILNISFSI